MGITYNGALNMITIVGYGESTPCTFLDIYNADVAGGWGVVNRQCTDQYCIDCRLVFGDGIYATWFADTSKQVTLNSGVGNYEDSVLIKAHAHFRLGTLVNDARKETVSGCSILDNNGNTMIINTDAANVVCELYSCTITGNDNRKVIYLPGVSATSKAYNCIFSNGVEFSTMAVSIYNVSITKADWGVSRVTGTIDRVDIKGITNYALYAHNAIGVGTAYFKNVVIRNCTNTFKMYIAPAADQYMINCDVDNWIVYFEVGATGILYRQNEFDLKIIQEDAGRTPIVNMPVKIWDLDNNLVCDTTTDANGEIPMQTLTFGYYHLPGGSTPVMKTPHKIQIRDPNRNFLTVTKYMYMDYKRTEVISMVDMTDVVDLLDDIDGKTDDVLVEVNNPDQFKADVSALATSVALAAVQTDLDNPDQFKADVSDLTKLNKILVLIDDLEVLLR